MNNTKRFALTFEALTELADEIKTAQAAPQPALPTLSEALAEYSSLPREALFLGLASDGLPVLLNLHDPVPGPLLVSGDAGCGKTAFLRLIARGVEEMHDPQAVQYGIITPHTDEWEDCEESAHCAGVYSVKETRAAEFLDSLSAWAHSAKDSEPIILLLIDDFEAMTNLDHEAKQNLRWLLLRGPARRVWPIVTLNSRRVLQVNLWLDLFHTRLFGHMDNPLEGQALAGGRDARLEELMAGVQFKMREGSEWLSFWIPSLE